MPKTRCIPPETAGPSVGRLLTGSLLGLILTVAFTFCAAMLLQQEVLPVSSCSWIGLAIMGISASLCALFSSWHNGKKLISGFISAGVYYLVLLVCGMLLFAEAMPSGRLIASAMAIAAGAIVGVIVSAARG